MAKVKCVCSVCKKKYLVFPCRLPTKYCSHSCQAKKKAADQREIINGYTEKEKKELLKERISRRVIDIDGCWIWNGCVDRDGYGDMTFLGKSIRAHRASYSCWNGKIPNGKFVCHTCDIPACCNPKHLFIGTAAVNRKDAVKKGRFNSCRLENHYNAKLKNKDVVKMWRLFKKDVPMKMIAKIFGVSLSTVENIKYGRNWKHI